MAAGAVAAELRELTDEELVAALRESKEELFNLRFQMATGQLDNNRRLRTVRHDIARIYTVMRERELGLVGRTEKPRPVRKAPHERERADRRAAGRSSAATARSGRATSCRDKMDKTIVVELEDRVKHPLYGKIIRRPPRSRRTTRRTPAGIGDRVLLMETRPLSATKRWRSWSRGQVAGSARRPPK